MSETPKTVTAQLAPNLSVTFDSVEDCLLFVANFGPSTRFFQTFKQLTGDKARMKDWRKYSSPEGKIRCAEMMARTHLSDGSTLLEAVKRKVVQ